ncbi:LemA family protein [Phytobacter massiliensis]|uniref:LemA family protein n=1 Tax=Phytobacter massiliensis TaxID=1485952 RepID=UPI00030A3884|nr:LemA family protein [Phytobacter massiliensis]
MNNFIALIILILIVIGCASMLISLYNRLVMLRLNVDKSFANIDVLLKQRVDELPELVKVVKASAAFEQETLMQLTTLRMSYLESKNGAEKVKLNNQLNSGLKDLFALAESYPQLRTNQNYQRLQSRISEIEDHIADRREFFNESVTLYNVGINEFPAIILARLMGYQNQPLLQISAQEKEYAGLTL